MTIWKRRRGWYASGAALGLLVATATAASGMQSAAGRTIDVHDAQQLTDALAAAKAGDTIQLAAGAYDGEFTINTAGAERAPITLTGPRDAVLSNGGGYGLHLTKAEYWNLTGFAVAKSGKGIVLDGSDHVTIDKVEVSEVGAEAVHFRAASSDNVVKNSVIHDTGRKQPQYGEAIYFGSAKSNWSKYGENGGPDRSDRNQAVDNTIGPNVSAEAVDIKEGTEAGRVRGNKLDGHGISGKNYADSWLDLKGNGYRIEHNTGSFDGTGALLDGYQTHTVVDGYGCGNTFQANDSDLGGAAGYAVNVTNQAKCDKPNVVYADNKASNAGKGLTNIKTTSGGKGDPSPSPSGEPSPTSTAPKECTLHARSMADANAAKPGDVVCFDGDMAGSRLQITKGGTPEQPVTYAGNGQEVKGITIEADNVVVDGYESNQPEAPGIELTGNNITVSHNTVTQPEGGDGDGMRFFGNHLKILGNTVSGTSNDNGHADCMQTFASDTPASQDVRIEGNRCEKIDNMCLMAEGPNDGEGDGNGHSDHFVIKDNFCETLQASQTLMIEDVQHCTITGNEFAASPDHAIGLAIGSTYAHVSGNKVSPGIGYEVGIDDSSMEGYEGPDPGGAP